MNNLIAHHQLPWVFQPFLVRDTFDPAYFLAAEIKGCLDHHASLYARGDLSRFQCDKALLRCFMRRIPSSGLRNRFLRLACRLYHRWVRVTGSHAWEVAAWMRAHPPRRASFLEKEDPDDE